MFRWKHTGSERPAFADEPGRGQESVWDYPRPPALRADTRRIQVKYGELDIADSTRALRVLETASPPTFYLPPGDIDAGLLVRNSTRPSFCEWKGEAGYYDLDTPDGGLADVAWSYPNPRAPFAALTGYFSFYPGKVQCYVDGERVRPQPGGFYGGWMTSEIVGPVKGEPGTASW